MRVFAFVCAAFGMLCVMMSVLSSIMNTKMFLLGAGVASSVIPYILFRIQSIATAEDQRKEIIDLLRQKSS